jgi:hypothetical protein
VHPGTCAGRLSAATIGPKRKKEFIVGRTIGRLVTSLAIAAIIASVGLMPASAKGPAPFQAEVSGAFTYADATHLILVGEGTASFLDKITSSGAIAFLGPADCGGFRFPDDETLASTADEIRFSLDADACPTATAGVYQIHGRYTVSGGSGRFAGASGKGTADGEGNFNNMTFRYTLKGTISRPTGG